MGDGVLYSFSQVGSYNKLVEAIIQHSLELVTDPFGNYVVQYILDLDMQPVVDSVTDALLGHTGSLCMDKFSSNVVEKVRPLKPVCSVREFVC